MSEVSTCLSCRRPNATLTCESCRNPLCKKCSEFLDADTFSFLESVPPLLSHTHYCPTCHSTHIEPALAAYEATMELARQVYVFFSTQKKPLPVLKRAQHPVLVKSCADRDETVLRLAFRASEQGFNAILEAEIVSEKLRNEGYQTSQWKGTGLPALLDSRKLERSYES